MKNFSEVEWNWERQPEEGEHAITCNVGFKNPETGLSDETSFDMKIETAEEELKDLFDEFCEENDFSEDVEILYIDVVDFAASIDELEG